VAKADRLYHNITNLTGKQYGRLSVLGYSPSVKHQLSRWVVLCSCGNKFSVYGMSLTSGKTKSCGCLQRETATTHGNHKHPLYKTWISMNYRCNNPSSKDFKNYGARGIRVDFNSFEEFCNAMGTKPNGFTIERVDVNGHYSPENCVWIENKKQVLNRRCSVSKEIKLRIIELHKQKISRAEIASLCGVSKTTVIRATKNCV
jgi:hypothetical protein